MDFVRILYRLVYFTRGRYFGWLLIVAAAVYIALLILGGLGLYKMASRQGLKHKWRAFVPFANSNLMGKMVENECSLFNLKIKNIKIWLVAAEVIAALAGLTVIVCNVACYSNIFGENVRASSINEWGATVYTFDTEAMTAAQRAIFYGYYYGRYIWSVLDLIYLVFFIAAITYLFRRYAPAQYSMFTLLSVFFGIEGIFIFALRNKNAVNYRDYVKERMARYRVNNPYYGNNRGGYGGNSSSHYNYDPYTGKPVNHNGNENSQSAGDPFPEFDGDKNSSSSQNNGNSGGGENGSSSDNSSNPFDL